MRRVKWHTDGVFLIPADRGRRDRYGLGRSRRKPSSLISPDSLCIPDSSELRSLGTGLAADEDTAGCSDCGPEFLQRSLHRHRPDTKPRTEDPTLIDPSLWRTLRFKTELRRFNLQPVSFCTEAQVVEPELPDYDALEC